MLYTYFTAIFIICLSIYTVYIYKIGNKNSEIKQIVEDMDVQLRQIRNREDVFENVSNKLERLMHDPIDNINKVLSLIESINTYNGNIIESVHRLLSDLSNLKSQIENINNKITRFEMQEVLTNIENLQKRLGELKNINNPDVSIKIEHNFITLKNVVVNLSLSETEKTGLINTLTAVETFVLTIKSELQKFQKLLQTLPNNVEIIQEIKRIHTNKQTLLNILNLGNTIKTTILKLVTDIKQLKRNNPAKNLVLNVENSVLELNVLILNAINNVNNINELFKVLKTEIDGLQNKLPPNKDSLIIIELDKNFKVLERIKNIFNTSSNKLPEIKNKVITNSASLNNIQQDLKRYFKQINNKIDSLEKCDVSDDNSFLKRIKDKIDLLQSCNIDVKNINTVLQHIKSKTDSLDNCKFYTTKTTPFLAEIKKKVETLKNCSVEISDKNYFLKQIKDSINDLLQRTYNTEIANLNQIKNKIYSIENCKIDLSDNNLFLKTIKEKIDSLKKCDDNIFGTNSISEQILSKIDLFKNIDVSKNNPTLNEIYTNSQISNTNMIAVQQIVHDLHEACLKLTYTLEHTSYNLINNAFLYIKHKKEGGEDVLPIQILGSDSYNLKIESIGQILTKTINAVIYPEKVEFTLTPLTDPNVVHIKSSIPCHIDNTFRALLGFEPVDVEIFQNEYTGTKPHNIDNIRLLYVFIHNHNIDEIVNEISAIFNNHTESLGEDFKTIYNQIIQSFQYINRQYKESDDLKGMFEVIHKMYLLHMDMKKTWNLDKNEDYSINNVLNKIILKLPDRFINMIEKTDLVKKQLVIESNKKIIDNAKKAYKQLVTDLGTAFQEIHELINTRMTKMKTLIMSKNA